MKDQLFSITGDGGPRLLSEVLGVLAHRRTEVRSFNAHSEHLGYRIHVLVNVQDETAASLLHRRLDRIVGVTKTVRVGADDGHRLCSVLARVRCSDSNRGQVTDVARAFGAEIVEVLPASICLSYAATPSRVNEFLALIGPFGIRELAESGTIALTRGSRAASRPSLRRVALR